MTAFAISPTPLFTQSSRIPLIEGKRRYAKQRFPYLIFYTELEEVIWVIA